MRYEHARASGRTDVLNRATDGQNQTVPPAPPIEHGWLVTYYSRTPVKIDGRWDYPLCGGVGDREHGTVTACTWNGKEWLLSLTDGTRLPLRAVRSVGKTDQAGTVISAWIVAAHGFDGTKEQAALNDERAEVHEMSQRPRRRPEEG